MSETRPVAVITGGARRVGAAICRRFHAGGFDVVLTYRSSESEACELVGSLERSGATARAIRCDLADPGSVADLCERLIQDFSSIDALVHSASTYEPSPLGTISAEAATRQYTVNALAPLLLTQGVSELLESSRQDGGGSVTCMCDIHSMGRPRKGFSAYSMSKAALAEMVHSLARDLAPRVRVNGVAPGVVAFPDEGYESTFEAQQAYLTRVPLERSGTPEEAAEVVHWLATTAPYVTGEIIRLDGGRWLA